MELQLSLLTLKTQTQDGLLIAHLEGEIDMSNVKHLRRALEEEVSNQLIGVILDLSACEYLDSSGIEYLFSLYQALQKRQISLALVLKEEELLWDTLESVRLSELVKFYPTSAQAQAEL